MEEVWRREDKNHADRLRLVANATNPRAGITSDVDIEKVDVDNMLCPTKQNRRVIVSSGKTEVDSFKSILKASDQAKANIFRERLNFERRKHAYEIATPKKKREDRKRELKLEKEECRAKHESRERLKLERYGGI